MFPMNFSHLSLLEIRELIQSGKTTAREVFEHFHRIAKEKNPEINAFVTLADVPQHFNETSPLAGIPLGVKDVFSQK